MAWPQLDHSGIFDAIQKHLHSPRPVAERMGTVLALCELSMPHPGWAAFRDLPYNRLAPLRAWLRRVFEAEPPAIPLAGLWIGIHHPIRDGAATSDLRLRGSTRFANNGELDWATAMEYRPAAASARSATLGGIHSAAYAGDADRLGNNATWPLCLAYSVFALQRLLSEIPPDLILRGGDSVGVAVGFDSGDYLLVGRLLPGGLVPMGVPDA